jgi:hypothetical protein
VTTETKDKVGVLIRDDCLFTTSKMCTTVWIGKLALIAIIRELGSRKGCTNWVLKMLTVELKTAQKYVCAEFLQFIEKVVDAFL